jgi:hypothetical protein
LQLTQAELNRREASKMRVFKWITSTQIKYFKYSEIKDKLKDLNTEACGICIDEFENADETIDD